MIAESLRFAALAGLLIAQSVFETVCAGEPAGSEERGLVASIALANPSEFERPDENALIPLSTLGVKNSLSRTLSVTDGEALLPSQLVDDDGDGEKDSLVFNAGFGPTESRVLHIFRTDDISQKFEKRTQAEISIKQGGAWEERKYIGGLFHNVQAVTPPPAYTDQSEFIRYEGPGLESDLVGYRV